MHDPKKDLDIDEEKIEEEIKKDEQQLHKKIWPKIVALIALLLLLLIISISFPLYYFESQIEGKKFDQNLMIDLKDKKIFLSDSLYAKIEDKYIKNSDKEFAICMTGQVIGDSYYMIDYYTPNTFFRSFVMVESEMCNKNTLIALHSHPSSNCIFSEADINYYNKLKTRNRESILGLMCGTNKFNFYYDKTK